MKLLVVDDDPELLDALTVGFQLHWRDSRVIGAGDGEVGLRAFDAEDPDLVVLDVMLPRRNGFEVLRAIRQVSDVPVLMLTHRGEEADQVRGLALGADDYVIKPFAHRVLLARIQALLRRSGAAEPARALPDLAIGEIQMDFRLQQVYVRGEPAALTPIEYKLLYQLVRNAGRVLPSAVLISRVWGEGDGATRDHLKVYISRLRAKLARAGAGRCIETAPGVGYRFAKVAAARGSIGA